MDETFAANETLSLAILVMLRAIPAIQQVFRSYSSYVACSETAKNFMDMTSHAKHTISDNVVGVLSGDACTRCRYLLETRNLEVDYGQRHLRFPNIRYEGTDAVGIICGPSGSGKTTLLNVLIGACDFKGHVSLEVAKSVDQKPHIGYAPQSLWFQRGSIGSNIDKYLTKPLADFSIGETLNFFALAGFKFPNFDELNSFLRRDISDNGDNVSGGERKRLSLVICLLNQSDIIIVDEPTSGLDPIASRTVLDALSMISTVTPVLAVTHDREMIASGDVILDFST